MINIISISKNLNVIETHTNVIVYFHSTSVFTTGEISANMTNPLGEWWIARAIIKPESLKGRHVKALLITLCLCLFGYTDTLDSLLIQSGKKANLQGILVKTKYETRSPKDLFHRLPDRVTLDQPSLSMSSRMIAMENALAEMSLSVDKLTRISENLLSQNNYQAKNSNLLMKLIEMIITTIGGIIIAYFTFKIRKKNG